MERIISKRERPAQGTGLRLQIDQRRSEFLVCRGGGLVDGVLGGFLGVAHGLLALAFDFLNGAFALHLVGADGFADALLGLAHGLVGRAFDLVCGATHKKFSFCDMLDRTSLRSIKCSATVWFVITENGSVGRRI